MYWQHPLLDIKAFSLTLISKSYPPPHPPACVFGSPCGYKPLHFFALLMCHSAQLLVSTLSPLPSAKHLLPCATPFWRPLSVSFPLHAYTHRRLLHSMCPPHTYTHLKSLPSQVIISFPLLVPH